MRGLWKIIRHFFFPPPSTSPWLRVLPYIVMGILSFTALYFGAQGWDYANSSTFCGTTCHTMPPEFNAYLQSPHARVQCVECHIGRDILTTQFTRKAGDLRHVFAMVFKEYEYPIFVKGMRPARDSCERCHFPEKFSDDSLREIKRFLSDEANTPDNLILVMKTGGGVKREGLGLGIHWHIESEVWFLASDKLEQNIPYVRAIDENGQITEYYDIASGFSPEDVSGKTLERMDCITCHNRITHSIPNPSEAVDRALSKGLISTELPYIRKIAISLLSIPYATRSEAMESFSTLPNYYAEKYPEVYQEHAGEINKAISVLRDINLQTVFPDQKIDWTTHPDNLGHKNSPGCYRCHDGKHLSGTGEAIRLECNLCHSIPVKTNPGEATTRIEIVSGQEPPSHTHTSWIGLHGKAIDSSCKTCHPPSDPSIIYTELEGKPPVDDKSFCGNSACHGTDWQYIGLNAPEIQSYLNQQLYILLNTSPYLVDGAPRTYEGTFKAIFDGRCTFCHSGPKPKADLDLSTYASIMQGGKSGPGIVPGSLNSGAILERQTASQPHFGQMIPEEITALENWILAGAPEK